MARRTDGKKGMLDFPTVAQACIERLGEQYVRQCLGARPDRALPREADLLAFACLHVCESRPRLRRAETARALTACRDVAARCGRGIYGDLETVIWDLCGERAGLVESHCVRDRVVRMLASGDSSVRGYFMEMAWFIRHGLPVEAAAPLLLKNVADTLGGWSRSLGLCSTLFEDEDSFFAYAQEKEFEAFQGQYEDRIERAQKDGVFDYATPFHLLENSIHTRIQAVALGLPTYDRRA